MGPLKNWINATPEEKEARREKLRKFFWTGVFIVVVALVVGLAVSCKFGLIGL